MQQQIPQTEVFLALPLAIVLLVGLLFAYLKTTSKRRLMAVRSRAQADVPIEKIIVGLQLEGLIVKTTDTKQPGYKRLMVENEKTSWLGQLLHEFLGRGVYFKTKATKKHIQAHLTALADNPKVELFLYTSLSLSVAEALLQRLGISHLFKPQHRVSCNDMYRLKLKHPTEVDFNTKRVIIATGSRHDHSEEDSKYFCVLGHKTLVDLTKMLDKVIRNNQEIDELHNELAEMKLYVESDCEC